MNNPDCYLNSDIFSDTWHFGANGNGTLSGDELPEEDKFLNPHPVLQTGPTAVQGTSSSFGSPSSSSSAVSSQSANSANSSNASPNGAPPAATSTSSNNCQSASTSGVKVKLEPFFGDHSEFNMADDIDIDGDLTGNAGLLVDSGNCSLTSFSTSPVGATTHPFSASVGGNGSNNNGVLPSTVPNQNGSTELSACSSFLSDHLK